MGRPKSSAPIQVRYDHSKPLLRELVLVHVDTGDGWGFDMLLTRVPGIGEELNREDRSYLVKRVQHEPVNDDGRARLGWHAFVYAELLPEEEETTPKPSRRKPTRRKSS